MHVFARIRRPAVFILCSAVFLCFPVFAATPRPNIILVMADDMGWGQTQYRGHPVLKTPHLDAMAANGLRFERFYAGAPNCSPTRASVLTGRTNDRTGVVNHGYALRRQEKTLAAALRDAGYATAHFGKWHLNGYQGPGVPVLGNDTHHPGAFGFEEWLSVTNFFDRDPLLSRQGRIEAFAGDSSEIIVAEALRFISRQRDAQHPFLAVVWYGTPHSPFIAAPADKAAFADLPVAAQNHYGELVAMDRSIGALRRGLREIGVADNTLLVFCSDNGGLPGIKPETVGGLRGFKNTVYEGGLRVPAIFEWPAVIAPRITHYPAGTVDLFPTIADLVGLPASALLQPQDGISLKPLLTADLRERPSPLGFRHLGRAAWIDNRYKLVLQKVDAGNYELFDLETDPGETTDLSSREPALASRLYNAFLRWNASVAASASGKDYPEGQVDASEPPTRRWSASPEYQPYVGEWKGRPEFRQEFERRTTKP